MSKLFHHLEGVQKGLKAELEQLLQNAGSTPLAQRSSKSGSDWAIVHKSRAGDSAITDKFDQLKLVVYFSEDMRSCVALTDQNFCFDQNCNYWFTGTQIVIDNFIAILRIIHDTDRDSIRAIEPASWIRVEHILRAIMLFCEAAILSCGDWQLRRSVLGILPPQLISGLSIAARDGISSLPQNDWFLLSENWRKTFDSSLDGFLEKEMQHYSGKSFNKLKALRSAIKDSSKRVIDVKDIGEVYRELVGVVRKG